MRKILLVLVLLLLVSVVSANTVLNFQNPSDFVSQMSCVGTCTWSQSTNGGNSYIEFAPGGIDGQVLLTDASAMTYSAMTCLEPTNPGIFVTLYDSVGGVLWSYTYDWGHITTGSRIELKIVGLQAYVYSNGILQTTSGVLSQNPSNVGWNCRAQASTHGALDDIVWGSSESLSDTASDKYVYGMPELTTNGTPYYTIMKDFINPAASGFYYGNGTLIYSNKFYSTFAKGNNNSDTINLQGYTTGVNVLSNTTGTAHAGTIQWDLVSFFAASPNYGLYAMHSESSLKYSDMIVYIGNGATISWDKPTYSQGESGSVITVVTDGGYWDPATYDYRIDVIDIYGTLDATYDVTTQSATTTHDWDADQDIGIYYAVLIAEPKDGSDEIWMNYAICNVDAYLTISGYVHDAETTLVIPNATVNITQASTPQTDVNGADGYYVLGNMSQGATVTIHVNATGYDDYDHQFTPLRVGALALNFTLMPSSPTYTGIALGGVAREPPYNRTIANARVDIVNSSDGHTYVATTNSVGYYIQNNMAGPSHWFDVWGSKTGFLNSTVYQKLVVGS